MAKTKTKNAAATPDVLSRSLTYQEGSSNKFWNIHLDGSSHTVTFGRVGTQGQTQTKDFESPAVARKSFDKLVAEKMKKGYLDAVGDGEKSSTGQSPVKAVAKSASKKTATAVIKAEPEKSTATTIKPERSSASPKQEIGSWEVIRRIDLDPIDWMRATFRQRTPIKRDPIAPFNRFECAQRLSEIAKDCIGWKIRWHDLKLATALSREEARFWLEAMTKELTRDVTPKMLVEELAAQKLDVDIDVDGVNQLLYRQTHYAPTSIVLVLSQLLDINDFVRVIQTPAPEDHAYWEVAGRTHTFIDGVARYAIPFWSDAELAIVRKSVKKICDPAKIPDVREALPMEFYVPALTGMHDLAHAISSALADDRYLTDAFKPRIEYVHSLVFGLGSAELVESEWRRLKLKIQNPDQIRGLLACTEYAVLDCIRDGILAETNKEVCEAMLKTLALVKAPEAAEPMLQCKLFSKAPVVARQWLDENVGCAVAGLIPTAGGRGTLADAALEYLQNVKRMGGSSLIEACLKSTTDAVVAAKIRAEVLDREEKSYEPFNAKTTPDWLKTAAGSKTTQKPPRLPAWAAPSSLPPLTISEQQLNDEQMAAVIQALATTPLGAKHPLLSALSEHIEPPVCGAFAWKLFQHWQDNGSPSKDKWAMGAIGHLGDDGCVMKLTPLVRNWPGESQHARAVFGLECLRAIGSSTALMQLAGIAQKLKFKGLKTKAEQFVNEIAVERGMTRAELEDRIIPDCGLDEDGRREFSFGARSFSFVLGGDLKPMIRDADGKVKGDLPKPGAKDDATLAAASTAEWKLLKKQIKDVATIQAGRLEHAMTTGRRWSVADFETLLVRQPLMSHLVRQLIWGAFDTKGNRITTFRVTDERDFADAKDKAVSIAKAASVGVLHPLEMSDGEKSAWGEVLSEYEVAAPFPQLGRTVYSLEKGEDKSNDLKRFHGMKLVAPTLVFTLEKLGWIRGMAMDGGGFDEHSKQFPTADVTAVISYEGTVAMGYIDPGEILTVQHCHFVKGMRKPDGYGWNLKNSLPLGKLPPVVVSEVIADLNVLQGKAK